jgi:SAM-dependent methyltransferase
MSEKVVSHVLEEPSGGGPFCFSVGTEIRVAGWAFVDGAAPPSAVLEVVSRQSGARVRVDARRSRRPDVARHFGAKTLEMSGFAGTVRVECQLQGENQVRLLQVEPPPGSVHVVDLFSFTVTPTVYETHVRRDIAAKFLRGSGLEIGALQRPLPVPDRCTVTYVDRMPLAELLLHYPELRGLPIQKPDLVDDGETLRLVAPGSQQFVVANHFLEHCENPIEALATFARVLAPGGVLYMAVPDKRFTFDIDRPATPYDALADAFERGVRRDRDAQYVEWAAYVNRVPESEVSAAAARLRQERYSIHFNVWALADLVDFLQRAIRDGELPFSLAWIASSENEVIVILRKHEADPSDV